MVNLSFDERRLNKELLIFFLLKFVVERFEDLKGIMTFVSFEQKFSEAGLDSHSQERAAFLLAPLNDESSGVHEHLVVTFKSVSNFRSGDSQSQVI